MSIMPIFPHIAALQTAMAALPMVVTTHLDTAAAVALLNYASNALYGMIPASARGNNAVSAVYSGLESVLRHYVLSRGVTGANM